MTVTIDNKSTFNINKKYFQDDQEILTKFLEYIRIPTNFYVSKNTLLNKIQSNKQETEEKIKSTEIDDFSRDIYKKKLEIYNYIINNIKQNINQDSDNVIGPESYIQQLLYNSYISLLVNLNEQVQKKVQNGEIQDKENIEINSINVENISNLNLEKQNNTNLTNSPINRSKSVINGYNNVMQFISGKKIKLPEQLFKEESRILDLLKKEKDLNKLLQDIKTANVEIKKQPFHHYMPNQVINNINKNKDLIKNNLETEIENIIKQQNGADKETLLKELHDKYLKSCLELSNTLDARLFIISRDNSYLINSEIEQTFITNENIDSLAKLETRDFLYDDIISSILAELYDMSHDKDNNNRIIENTNTFKKDQKELQEIQTIINYAKEDIEKNLNRLERSGQSDTIQYNAYKGKLEFFKSIEKQCKPEKVINSSFKEIQKIYFDNFKHTFVPTLLKGKKIRTNNGISYIEEADSEIYKDFKEDFEFILQKLYDNCHYKEGKSTKLNNDITFSVFTSEEYEKIQTKINLIRQQTKNLLKNSTDGSQKTKYETNLQAANKLLDYITKDKKINNAYLEINNLYKLFFSESFKPKENIEEIKPIPLGIEELIEEKQNLEKQIIVLQNQIKNTNNNDFINDLQEILNNSDDNKIIKALKKELNENKKDKNGNIVKLDGVTLKKYQTISGKGTNGSFGDFRAQIENNPEYEILQSLIKFYEQKIALEKGIEPVKNKLKNLAKKANQANKDIQKANQEQPFKSDEMIESDFKNAEGSTDKLMAYLALLDDQMTDINNGIYILQETIDKLKKENETLKEENQTLEKENEQLKQDANLIKQEKKRLTEILKQKNENGEININQLNEKNFPILYKEGIIQLLKERFQEQQQTIQDQKAKIAELNQQITEHKEKQQAAQEQIKAIQELLGKQDQKNFDLNGVKEAVQAFIENNAKSLAQQQELQQQLNLQKTNLETQIKQLEQQIIDIGQTNQETLEQKQQELAGLQDQLQKVQTANSELVQQNTKNEQIIKGLREINEQLSQKQKGLDDQIKQNNSDIEKLKQQIETLNKGKNIDSNKIKELEQKITSLTTQNKELSDQVKDLQKAQVELNTAHQEELENLKLSYQNELDRIKQENTRVQNELSTEYNKLQSQLKSQYEEDLKKQKSIIESEYGKKIQELKDKGVKDLEQQKQALEAEQQIKLDNLKKQLEAEYTTKQQNIKDEYEAEKQQLQKQHDKKVQDLQSQIDDKDLLLSGVLGELEQSKINNQQLNETNQKLKSQIAGLEEEVATLTKQKDNVKEQYEAQKITNDELQQKLSEKNKEIENLKTDYEKQIAELNAEVIDFINKLNFANKSNENLLKQIAGLNSQIKGLNDNVVELTNIQQQLNEDIQKLQQKNQDLLKNNDELKQQNDEYIKKIETLTQNNEKISQDLAAAQSERDKKIQELQQAVTEKNEIQKQLDNEIKIKGEQSEKAKQLQQQLESKEQEFKTLQDSFAKEQAKVDNLYKNLAISNGKIGALQKQVQIQNKQIEDYKNQMKEANEQIKNSNIIYNELQSQYNILFNENEDNKQKINDLNTKVQGLVSAGEQYANQIKDITKQNDLLVQQLHQNEEDIKLKDDELKKQQDVIKQNNIAIQQKDEEIKQKQGELDVKEKTINDQIAKINEQLVQLDAANKNNEQLAKEKEQLAQDKQNLEGQMQTLNAQKQQLETDKSKLKTEKQDLQNKQSELQQSHDELSNQLGNIKVQLATANALHKNTVEEQNKQIKMINAKYAELQQQFKTNQEKAQEEIEKNKKEIERLTKEISDKEQQSQQKNEENQQKINELTQANKVLQEAMEGFADKANELEKQAAILQQQAEQAKQEYKKAKQENIQLQKQNQELADQTAQEGEQTNIQQGEAKNTEQIPSQKNNESDNIKDFKEKIDHYETIEWFDHDEIASNGGKDPSKLIKYEVKEFNKFYDDIENYLKSEKEKQQNDTPNQNIDEVEDILQRAKKIKEEYKDILQSNVNYNADNIEDMLHEADKILNRLETSNLDNLNAEENEYLLKYLGDLDNRIEEKITLETDAEERKKLNQYKDHLESLVEKYDNIFNGDNIKNMLDKAELMLLKLNMGTIDNLNSEENKRLLEYLHDLDKRIEEKMKSETDTEELEKLKQYRDSVDNMLKASSKMIVQELDLTDQNIEQHKNSEQKQKVLESPIGISNRSFAAIQNENVKEPTASELQKQALSEIVEQINLKIGDKQEEKKDDKQEEKKNDQSKDNSKQLANNEDGTEIKHQMSEHKETIDKEIPIIQGSQIERTIINKQGGHPINTENDLDNIPILTAKKDQQPVQKQNQEMHQVNQKIQTVSEGTQTISDRAQGNVSAAIKNVNSHIEPKGKQNANEVSTRGVEQEKKAQNQQFITKSTSNYNSFTQSNSDRDIFSMNFSSNGDNFSISKTNGNIDMQFDGKTDKAAEFADYINDLLKNSSKISSKEKTKNNFFTTNDTIELSRLKDKLSTKTKELQDDAIINRQSSILENSDLQDEIFTLKEQIKNLANNPDTISNTIAKKAKDANIEFGSVASVTYNDNSNKPTVSIFEFGNEEKINNYSSCTEIELTNGDKIRVRKSNDKSAYNGFSISLIKNGTTKEVPIDYNEKIKTVDENGKTIEISCEDIFDLPPITQQLFNAQSLDQNTMQKKEDNTKQPPTTIIKMQRKGKSPEIEHDTMGLSNITDGSMDDIDNQSQVERYTSAKKQQDVKILSQ